MVSSNTLIMTEEDLKELAAQLRQPAGEMGKEVGHMMHASNIGMTSNAIRHLQLQDGERVLELGYGNGSHLPYLMQQAAGLSYQGLDISPLMQQEAIVLHQDLVTGGQAVFSLYEGRKIPFEDDSFDKLFTVNTIYFWESPQELLQDLYRVLKPGGLFSLSFAAASFMQQLPFVRYGFELYDTGKASALIGTTAFRIIHTDLQTETVSSKTGTTVERNFVTLILQK